MKKVSQAKLAFAAIARALCEMNLLLPTDWSADGTVMPRAAFGLHSGGSGSILSGIIQDGYNGVFYGYRGKNRLFRFQVQVRRYGSLPGFNNAATVYFPCSISGPGLVHDGPMVEGGQSRFFTPRAAFVEINDIRNAFTITNLEVVSAITVDWTGTPSPEQAFNGTKWLVNRILQETVAGRQLLSRPEMAQRIFDRLIASIKRKNSPKFMAMAAQALASAYDGPRPEKLVASLLAAELNQTA